MIAKGENQVEEDAIFSLKKKKKTIILKKKLGCSRESFCQAEEKQKIHLDQR